MSTSRETPCVCIYIYIYIYIYIATYSIRPLLNFSVCFYVSNVPAYGAFTSQESCVMEVAYFLKRLY